MANWIEVTEPTDILTDISNMYNDMLWVKDKLTESGMITPVINQPSASYNTGLPAILTALNTIEQGIQNIYDAISGDLIDIEWLDEYYEEYIWSHTTVNKREQVRRWFNFINSVHDNL